MVFYSQILLNVDIMKCIIPDKYKVKKSENN